MSDTVMIRAEMLLSKLPYFWCPTYVVTYFHTNLYNHIHTAVEMTFFKKFIMWEDVYLNVVMLNRMTANILMKHC